MMPKASDYNERLPLLDGSNYLQWKTLLQNVLLSKGLGKFVTQKSKDLMEAPGLSAEKKLALEDSDEMALGHIKVHIAPSYLDVVRECKTALEAWIALEKFFEGKETFNKVYLLEQLWAGKLEETGNLMENIQEFVRDKTEVGRRLENAGMKFGDDVIAGIMLCRLPVSFDTMVRFLTSQKDLTVAKVKEELQREAMRRNVMRSENAFSATTDEITPSTKRRSEERALIADTPDPKRPRLDKSKLKCSFCDFTGHSESSYWLNPSSKYYRPDFTYNTFCY
jgi:gag-polypeptide of LTR copia-type